MSVNYFDNRDIVMLMAGDGSRFKGSKYDNTIKPLIEVNGKTILEWTLSSLPIEELEKGFINFAIRSEHDEKYNIRGFIESKYKFTDFKYFPKLTRGNLETAYLSICSQSFMGDRSILYLDSDNYYAGQNFFKFIEECKKQREYFAVVNYFEPIDDSTKWCFAHLFQQGGMKRVYDLIEKPRHILNAFGWKPMIGTFYFSSIEMFRRFAKKCLDGMPNANGEYYMSMVIDEYIKNEIPVFAYKSDFMVPLGTPEDVKRFENE